METSARAPLTGDFKSNIGGAIQRVETEVRQWEVVMSSPIDRPFHPGDPSPQLRPREHQPADAPEFPHATPRPANGGRPLTEVASRGSDLAERERMEHFVELQRFVESQRELRRKLGSAAIPPPPLAGRGWSGLSLVGFFIGFVLLGAGALASFVALEKYVASDSSSATAPAQGKQAALQPTKPQRAAIPHLVSEGARAENGDEVPLGIRVDGPSEGVTVIVRGLRSGMILSAGRPLGEGGWVVPASELARTNIRPPQGFSGTMEYTATLQLDDGTVVDQQAMRLDWAETPSAAEPRSSRQLDPEEMATLLRRGQEMFETGDLAGARLLLQRAADAGNARAAFALGASYDPLVLDQMGVHGVAADVAKARAWYEKAAEYGSTDAPKRLQLLTSHVR